MNLPSNLTLSRYRLTLEAVETLHLPAFKGSALRGGFGHTFKRLVCLQPWQCGDYCQKGNECPHGYIFETKPPPGSQALSKNEYVARPFVIEPPLDPRSEYQAGERLAFHLVLVGRAQEYLDYFVITFKELGRVGLGKGRGKYRIAHVEAAQPFEASTVPSEPEAGPAPGGTQAASLMAGRPVTAADIEAQAAALPADSVRVRFLTPTRLIHDKQLVHPPPFHVLARRLLDRVSSLSYFHCGQRWEVDFKALIEQAHAVELAGNNTRWMQLERYSGRQHERLSLGGFVGDVVYRGDLAPFRTLLLAGQLVHVGKASVFGNGQYQIEQADREDR